MTVYCIDTSALLDGIERFYPAFHFPRLWEKIDELVDDGRLIMSEEAWDEAQSVDKPAKEWCNEQGMERHRMVIDTSSEIATVAGEIVNDYPHWVSQGRKNGADPFVIAVAETYNAVVISGEVNGGPGKPKIPYVCQQRGIEHGQFIEIIKRERWVMG